ncbi:putative T7SS-secreted protein [Amycolatopsis thailandensis]|uniref:putative T7SS-secreted protein n=1 Tax=Amycolatopsis thailandensis TaxID=589330 RepID=UPI0036459410
MAELGQTTDPKALIPGDPPAVYENARVLEARANSAGAVGDALKRIDTGGWRGPASDRFHEDHQTEVPRWMQADDSLDNAAQALTAYADTLAWAQGQAAEAIAQWQRGDTATEQAEQAYDRAVADAQTRTRANAERGDPTVVQPPAFTDPGEAHRQAARDILKRARRQLAEAGDRCTEALRVEASLAPQDSRRQADANFYGGIRDSISGAGEALWGAISDPGGTVAAMAHNVMHPVETFKAITAWDDWANGHGDRALGKITGGLLVGLGSGKLLKDLAGRKHHDADAPAEHRPGTPASTPEARVERVQQGITDNRGNLLGVEDSKGVRLIDEAQLNQVRQHFHDNLGAPTKVYETPKGTVEFWEISTDPKQQVVYRTYSGSGGATIDINGVSGVDMKRFHIK